MAAINFILADHDEYYVESLGKFIRERNAGRFNVYEFTRFPALAEYAAGLRLSAGFKPARCMLLAGPGMMREGAARLGIEAVAVLSEGVCEQCGDKPEINRYQPADRIMQSIMEVCWGKGLYNGSFIREGRHSFVTAVYSPIGGSGKSLFSINLAAHCVNAGKKTLLLDFEAMDSIGAAFRTSVEKPGMSALLYHLRENRKDFLLKLDSLKHCDPHTGIYRFGSFDSPCDIDEMTAADAQELISEIRRLGQFDNIVVDTSSSFAARYTALLHSCDTVLLIHSPGAFSERKFILFDQTMKKNSAAIGEDIYDKMVLVLNKADENHAIPVMLPHKLLVKAHKVPVFSGMAGEARENHALSSGAHMAAIDAELAKKHSKQNAGIASAAATAVAAG